MQSALDNVRRFYNDHRYDEGLAVIADVCALKRTSESSWPPPRTRFRTSVNLNNPVVEELVMLGIRCSIAQSRESLASGKDWQIGLRQVATGVQLFEASATLCDRWRSDESWARVRIHTFGTAAEALMASKTKPEIMKAQGCLERCEAVLKVWPRCVNMSAVVTVHVKLAEARWRLGNSAAARNGCEGVLKMLAPRLLPTTLPRGKTDDSILYSAMLALSVLHSLYFREERIAESAGIRMCAEYIINACDRRKESEESRQLSKRLLAKMTKLGETTRQADVPCSLQRWPPPSNGDPDLNWLLGGGSLRAESVEKVTKVAAEVMPAPAIKNSIAVTASPKQEPESSSPIVQDTASGAKDSQEVITHGPDAVTVAPASKEVMTLDPDAVAVAPASTIIDADGNVVEASDAYTSNFCLLAVEVLITGHELPIWRVAMSAQSVLKDVLKRWGRSYFGLARSAQLPPGVKATSGPQGSSLDLGGTLQTLRPLLCVRDGRHWITVSWPVETRRARPDGGGSGAAPSAAGKLGSLSISTRYANVDGNALSYHSSSTQQAKIDAGAYEATQGQFGQAAFLAAMRTPPEPKTTDLVISTRELHVFDQTVFTHGDKPMFTVTLRGPVAAVANWEATCDKFQKAEADANTPYPVFIPTRGRATRGCLNWEADHVFGSEAPPAGELAPVVAMVVEPREEEEYRDEWPFSLALVLPQNGRGAGYVRWVIQRVCSRAYLRCKDGSWKQRRLPYVWIADDGLSMFYRLVAMKALEGPETGVRRLKERKAPEGAHMFREALLEVQRHALLPKVAVAGFLRDDGTAVCKRKDWKDDELSLYKIVLLNLGALRRLGVQYQRDLQMYEDICLTHEVLKCHGRTLKCQTFCFRAMHSRHGGCAEQRHSRAVTGTQIDELMLPAALARLDRRQQDIVRELFAWVQSKERLSEAKSATLQPQKSSGHQPHKALDKSARLDAAAGTTASSSHMNAERRDRMNEKRRLTRDHKAEYVHVKKRRLERRLADLGDEPAPNMETAELERRLAELRKQRGVGRAAAGASSADASGRPDGSSSDSDSSSSSSSVCESAGFRDSDAGE